MSNNQFVFQINWAKSAKLACLVYSATMETTSNPSSPALSCESLTSNHSVCLIIHSSNNHIFQKRSDSLFQHTHRWFVRLEGHFHWSQPPVRVHQHLRPNWSFAFQVERINITIHCLDELFIFPLINCFKLTNHKSRVRKAEIRIVISESSFLLNRFGELNT